MKRIFISFLLLAIFFSQTVPGFAAKKSSTPSIAVSTSYLKPRNTVRAFFNAIKGVSKISYVLMYDGNGVGQGAMGSFSPGKKTSISRDVYLGTCSGRICTPHRNIKNLKLEVTAKFTNGKSSTKVYKVK